MKKIHIAYLTKNLRVNGISTVVMNYCKNLDKDKFDVNIIAGEPIAKKYRNECLDSKINLIVVPSKRQKNPFKYYNSLYKVLHNGHFDLIHIHGNSATITLELLIAYFCKIKVRIAHSHNTTCDFKIIHKLLRPFLNLLSNYKFACGKEAGRWMYGKDNFEIIKNSFNTEKYIFNLEKRNEIRKKLKIEDKLVLGHVGLYNDQKNHPILLKIFEKIASQNENAILLLIGDGPNFNQIKSLIDIHPYKERIIQYGISNNVSELYDAMDIFLLPSKYEGLVVVLLEAQIKGLYCIASDKVPNEVAFTSDSVKFLPIDNDSNLEKWNEEVKKFNMKIDRKEIYTKYQNFIQDYDIKKNVKKIENIYEDAFNSKVNNR